MTMTDAQKAFFDNLPHERIVFHVEVVVLDSALVPPGQGRPPMKMLTLDRALNAAEAVDACRSIQALGKQMEENLKAKGITILHDEGAGEGLDEMKPGPKLVLQ